MPLAQRPATHTDVGKLIPQLRGLLVKIGAELGYHDLEALLDWVRLLVETDCQRRGRDFASHVRGSDKDRQDGEAK